MSDVKIIGLNLVTDANPNLAGSVMVARFNCEVRGFVLHGCSLERTRDDRLVANAPKIEGPDGRRRAVMIADVDLRHDIMVAARAIYEAMGGVTQWQPQEEAAPTRAA